MKDELPSVSRTDELTLLPLFRFREPLRTVIDDGTEFWPKADGVRGDAPFGVSTGAGSLDRAECTLSSSFCILPMRPRIW